ncbi:MAG: type I restriction endonuclease subunit R [Opitutaceae bacterium]|jgi:type I restriction enzyme R subunit
MPNFISEDQIEQALLQKLQHVHGYDVLDCGTEEREDLADHSGRADKREVILLDRLRTAATALNPGIPAAQIDFAVEQIAARRPALAPVAANAEVYALIRDGVPVEFDDSQGRRQHERVRVVDFTDPLNPHNQFLAVSQLWIRGEKGFRRPDVILYLNGLPLVFIELKNSNVKLRHAFDDNLTTYRAEIPQLFLANAVCILSNALETRVGSFSADWEFFFPWLRADDEKQKIDREAVRRDGTSLEGVIAGLLPKARLLDYVENFVLYHRGRAKIVAQNHQFLGVNRAFDVFRRRAEMDGKLGVFWHTQGSGKSFSMIFYARKIFRKLGAHFTFVIVTDRDDLDGQIYRNFLDTGTVSKADAAQPKNSDELRKYLGQQKRLVFTLIQKFRWPKGQAYPLLTDRGDVVVIVDEAHRTQYKDLAENMRAGLKHAQFLAFTGTPLLGRDRKTNQWFGDYVSEYNFQQSMDDGATVPLYYQKRVPEMLIQNENLGDEFYELLDDANLDDAQQEKLEKQFATELEVIRRDDRLETIARDVVAHFPNRGYLGKAMFIAVDKFTAVKMFDKVERLWKERIKTLTGQVSKATTDSERAVLKRTLDWMKRVEMAVVISEDADEEKKFAKQNLEIARHRQRMNALDKQGHDIETNFKDPEHPLQLVFVCAMWLTGFDAPTVSTLYLDKPQKDHTLMQTIARANRVTSWKIGGVEKRNGEIVDYYNVFRRMKQALKDYAQGQDGAAALEVREKSDLFRLLDEAIVHGHAFCRAHGVHLEKIAKAGDIFKQVEAFDQYADALLVKDEDRKAFAVFENTITSLYEACKPEILGRSVVRTVAVFQYLRGVIDSHIQQADIDEVGRKIGELLDASVVVDPTRVQSVAEHETFAITKRGKIWDLGKIDFDKLKQDFKQTEHRNIEIADLRAFLEKKLADMLKQNATRSDFAERLRRIIEDYNAGGASNESYFEELLKFTRDLHAESERHLREGLTEDELELYDLLKKDKMTQAEEKRVKLAAKSLLERLTQAQPKVLVQEWFKDTQSKKRVETTVEAVLNEHLPDTYDRVLFKTKCSEIFGLIVNYASQGRKWAA